ncbi:excalibur calcium-binding domain-containing protein [Streptomyces sp. NBC_00335]|uniref:excalibur calcium-binding domain-containing protein n=1 Tax=unclassified Streptomyces TaxID=2593676 RepID=UPI00225A7C9B|nr:MULTISPECIES: excalibur calcium-binding domain-containing protein [unclassified Streptomyces]MCX5404546.1 excalibur calcium-binding domain-containing protein [Streptomyces sp. NBC_00086]
MIITLLVVFPPGGIALAWTSGWSKGKKITATVLAGLWFFTPFLGDPPEKTGTDAKPKATVTQEAAAIPAPSATAAPETTSVTTPSATAAPAAPKMPVVMGLPFARAAEILKPIGLKSVEPESAYADVTLPATVDGWKVCFQDPAEGKEIQAPKTVSAHLKVVAPGTACPAEAGARLHPDPDPAPVVPGDGDDSGGSSSGGSSSGGSSTGGSGSVSYKNCAAVRAAGADPIRRGDPGYGRHLDRDGDGVACE